MYSLPSLSDNVTCKDNTSYLKMPLRTSQLNNIMSKCGKGRKYGTVR